MKLCDAVAGMHRKHPNYDEVALYSAKQHMFVVPSLASDIWIRIESNRIKSNPSSECQSRNQLTSSQRDTNLHMMP